jgi:hypothetical protein
VALLGVAAIVAVRCALVERPCHVGLRPGSVRTCKRQPVPLAVLLYDVRLAFAVVSGAGMFVPAVLDFG